GFELVDEARLSLYRVLERLGAGPSLLSRFQAVLRKEFLGLLPPLAPRAPAVGATLRALEEEARQAEPERSPPEEAVPQVEAETVPPDEEDNDVASTQQRKPRVVRVHIVRRPVTDE